MDDGLAEKLFNAYLDALAAQGVGLYAHAWSELTEVQREAWLQVAITARADAAERQSSEVEMLRGANAGWQREAEERQRELHEALGLHLGDRNEFTWQDLLNAVRRDLRVLEGVRRAVEGL